MKAVASGGDEWYIRAVRRGEDEHPCPDMSMPDMCTSERSLCRFWCPSVSSQSCTCFAHRGLDEGPVHNLGAQMAHRGFLLHDMSLNGCVTLVVGLRSIGGPFDFGVAYCGLCCTSALEEPRPSPRKHSIVELQWKEWRVQCPFLSNSTGSCGIPSRQCTQEAALLATAHS